MILNPALISTALLLQQAVDKTKWKISSEPGSFLFPPQASTVAKDLDDTYYMIQNWSIFFTVLIFFVLFYFIFKYNRKTHPIAERTATHNTALELLWSVPPGFVLVYMFWRGFVGYLDLREPPQDSYQISVQAQKWSWTFKYPNGAQSGELHLPVGRPTTMTMTSSDVIHSFFIPAFRTKMDVVPGRYTKTWFTPTKVGQYIVECTEYCGTQHSDMLAQVFVHTEEDFQKWVYEEANWLVKLKYADAEHKVIRPDFKPAEAGKRVFDTFCTQCHRADTQKLIGPGLGGVFGHEVAFADGTKQIADEAYVQKSIEEPSAQIVAGFQGGTSMPTFKGVLQPDYIEVLVAYVKSLKDVK